MYIDVTGNFPVLATMLLTGAFIGFTGQVISDIITSLINGNGLEFSHWTSYVGATAGGMVGIIIPDPVISGAVSAFVTTFVSMTSETIYHKFTGEGNSYTEDEILAHSITDMFFGGVLGAFIPNEKIMKSITDTLSNTGQKIVRGIINAIPLDYYYGIKSSEALSFLYRYEIV